MGLLSLALSLRLASGLSLEKPELLTNPQLDFGEIGDVVVGGSGITGFTELRYTDQMSVLREISTNRDDLILSFGDDIYTQQPFSDGIVSHNCWADGMWILTGNFTEILNVSLPGIAGIYLDNLTVVDITTTLNFTDSLSGSEVRAVWCNESVVYFGGSFELNDTAGVVLFSSSSLEWSLPAFGGFVADSVVETIVPYDNHAIFGGNFTGLVPVSTMEALSGESNRTNATLLQPGIQPVSFSRANAAGYSTQGAAAENADSILCPLDSGSGWEAGLDSNTGYINVTLAYVSEPTRVRLYNLADGSGTKTFRIVSQPAGSYMNLTYTDGGSIRSCAAYCPLPEYNDTVRYTDFSFVNVVSTTSLQIQLLDFYGDHAGLKGIELFESGQYVFADNDLNTPRACNESVIGSSGNSQSNLVGTNWTLSDGFMETNITDKTKLTASYAEFVPNLEEYNIREGIYEVLVYTPGCLSYGTCSERGLVNVTVFPGIGASQTTLLYQTNDYLKYDVVYNGTLEQGAYIVITPVDSDQVPLDFVAYKVALQYLGSTGSSNATAIFEYAPENFTYAYDPLVSGPINSLGAELGSGVSVNAIMANGTDRLLIGGSNFPANVSSGNLISYSLNDSTVTGLDVQGDVTDMANLNDTLFVMTDETTYEVVDNELNNTGILVSAHPVVLTLNDTQYWAFDNDSALALFDPSTKTFDFEPRIRGRLTAMGGLTNMTLYTGSVEIFDRSVEGDALVLSNTSSGSSPLSVDMAAVSRLVKRDTDTLEQEVYAGAYLDSNSYILAGHFNATLSGNSTVQNAVEVQLSTASSIESVQDLPASSVFKAAAVLDGTLVLGGQFEGQVNSDSVQSLLVYNITDSGTLALASAQPPQLDSENSVLINTLAFKPQTNYTLVAGQFSSDSCTSLCLYDITNSSWLALPNVSFDADTVINSLVFQTGNKLVIAGSLRTNQTSGQVATYDFNSSSFSMLPQVASSGEAAQLVVLSNSTERFAVSVGANISFYDGSSWNTVSSAPFNSSSSVTALSVVSLNSNSNTSDSTTSGSPFSSSKALLVSGNLVTDDGNVSMAVFDGSDWASLYVASGSSSPVVRAVFAQSGSLKGEAKQGASTPSSTSSQSSSSSGTSTQTSTSTSTSTASSENSDHMPAGHVVGVACAIGIGCVLLLTLVYLLFEWFFTSGDSAAYQNLAQQPDQDTMVGTKIVR